MENANYMPHRCTLLLNSYDGGEDLWEGFFTALKDQWPQMNLPVVLNTESKSYSFPGYDIKTFNLFPPHKHVAWGKRMIETLKRIDTEYILFFLDDFWLDQPVDTEFVQKSFLWMEANPDVAVLSFHPTPGENIQDERFDRFERRPQKGPYRFNCQVAIWRRKRLLATFHSNETPWEWEVYGSEYRSPRFRDGFYSLKETAKPVFSYKAGWVVYRGKWCKDAVAPYVKKYNLNINFSVRGFEQKYSMANNTSAIPVPSKPLPFLQRLKMPHLGSRIKNRLRRELFRFRF